MPSWSLRAAGPMVALALLAGGCLAREGAVEGRAVDCRDGGRVAEAFVRDYLKADLKSDAEAIGWMRSRSDVTEGFKEAHRKLLAKARRDDPEMGLDLDPVLDAQDWPDHGMVAKTVRRDGYVVLVGTDWKDFELTAHLVDAKGRCRIDGIGIVNVPTDRRSPR